MDSINIAEVATKPEVISVIVPVYNVERYLRKCLDSIVNQTYPHLEIILVNDGSTDSSGEICEEYAARDPRIKLLHKENGGLSSARNYGLPHITGKYLAYVDSDDWLALDLYERCVEKFRSNKYIDAVFFEFENVYKDKPNDRYNINLEELMYSKSEPYLYALQRYCWAMYLNASVWNKVYKANLIQDLRFVEGKKYEDVLYTLMALTRIKGHSLLASKGNYTGYFYNRMNENSITYQIQPNISDLFDQLLEKYDECKSSRSELVPYIGTLISKYLDGLLNQPKLSYEVLQVAARYLRPVYALEHLNGGWTNEFKRTMIRLFPRLFVWAFYKKWLPPLSSK